MKLTFLGTGAADWPLQRPEKYKEYRRQSSALIDDALLIDPGPQVLDALKELGKDPRKIKYIINTHRHKDHFNAETLSGLEAMGAKFVPLTAGESVCLDGYTVSAYGANHGTSENAVHFLIAHEGRSLYYGLDGAWLLYEEIRAIKGAKPNLMVLDATVGEKEGDYRIFEHNNLRMVLEMKKTLQLYAETFCISHMARTLHTDHETLRQNMEAHGILTAYDGMELEV